MDQDLARRLFVEGAALVLLDVPERTEFGMDYSIWTVGPKFKGVKMIPPGFHFVFYSAVSRQGQSAPRTGFFHFFQRREVLVRRWDPVIEDITEEGISADSAERIQMDLKELDPFLGAYPYESLSRWVSLTNHITQELVHRIQPLSGQVSAVTQLLSEAYVQSTGTPTSSACSDTPSTSHDMSRDMPSTSRDMPSTSHDDMSSTSHDMSHDASHDASHDMPTARTEEASMTGTEEVGVATEVDAISDTDDGCGIRGDVFAGVGEFPRTAKAMPSDFQQNPPRSAPQDMKYVKEAMLRLSAIPVQKYPTGASPAQISHHNMDLSFSMETMLSKEYGNNEKELLGELQFCFVCFLVGHVYDAFEHWKELVKLTCFSEDALSSHTQFFLDFITVLHFQLKEIPEDFFVDIVSRSNFLTVTLQTFFSGLERSDGSVDRSLVKRGLQFRDNLTKKYKWDFSSEPDDFAPTVVDLGQDIPS